MVKDCPEDGDGLDSNMEGTFDNEAQASKSSYLCKAAFFGSRAHRDCMCSRCSMQIHSRFHQYQVGLQSFLLGTSKLWHLPAWPHWHLLQVLHCSGNLHILSVMGHAEIRGYSAVCADTCTHRVHGLIDKMSACTKLRKTYSIC